MQPGIAWQMVYSGFPKEPDHEIFKCLFCVEKNGAFKPQLGIVPKYSCGIFEGVSTI